MPELVVRSALDRAEAARARAEAMTRSAAGDQSPDLLARAALRSAPLGVGQARSLAFPAQLRAKLEQRGGQQLYHLSGIASVTDQPYEMWDMFGPYDEIVARQAFVDTLANEPDVAFLVNHKGLSMARTTNGTLELGLVDAGLGTEAWLNPKRTDVADLVTAVEDRTVDEMSFAFLLEEGRWSPDFTTFTITQLDINRGDVSAVNYGANPYTSIAARSREFLDELDRMPAGLAREVVARLSARADLAEDRGTVLVDLVGGVGVGGVTPTAPAPQDGDGSATTRTGGRHSLSPVEAWLAQIEARQGY